MATNNPRRDRNTRTAARLGVVAFVAFLILTAAFVLAGCAADAEQLESPTSTPSPTRTPSPATDRPAASATPTPAPVEPTPEPLPTEAPTPAPAEPGPLKPGDWVVVTGAGCLNARTRPGLAPAYPEENPDDNILNCLPDGFIGRLESAGPDKVPQPVEADGHTWWYMVAQGWVAQDWLAFHHEGGAFWPPRPDLAGAGLVAYIAADNSVMLMNADGSDAHAITAPLPTDQWVDNLAWSPTGSQLSISVSSWNGAHTVTTQIVDLTGAVVAEFPGLGVASWAPDGGRLAGIRLQPPNETGSSQGTPVVRDLVSGAEVAIGPASWAWNAPIWSPDGASLALICTSSVYSSIGPDGTPQESRLDCGGDGLRIVNADGSNPRVVLPTSADGQGPYYGEFSWSPAGDILAVVSYPVGDGCLGIVLVDVIAGASGECIETGQTFGFRCGGPGQARAEWTADARRLVYHGVMSDGRIGVRILDLATGSEAFIPISWVGSIDASLDGEQIVFEAGGSIWVADIDGTGSAPIADGRTPVWQPL